MHRQTRVRETPGGVLPDTGTQAAGQVGPGGRRGGEPGALPCERPSDAQEARPVETRWGFGDEAGWLCHLLVEGGRSPADDAGGG